MRDIQVGKRGSEAAGKDQPDKLKKTTRFEQEAPSAAPSSDPTVALEYPASGETQDRLGSVLVQQSGHVDDDVQISALDTFYEMGGRKVPLEATSHVPPTGANIKVVSVTVALPASTRSGNELLYSEKDACE